MKRKTLLALGMTGALACGSATAATFLCARDEPGGSTISCAEIPAEVLGSVTSGEDAVILSPPSVTYYLVPMDQDDVAMLGPSEAEMAPSGASDMSAADQWQHSEPRSMTYYSSPEFEAMNPSGQ